MFVAGLPLRDELILELARLVDDPDLAKRLENCHSRDVKVLALDIPVRETILQALDDPPDGLLELRATLLQEAIHAPTLGGWARGPTSWQGRIRASDQPRIRLLPFATYRWMCATALASPVTSLFAHVTVTASPSSVPSTVNQPRPRDLAGIIRHTVVHDVEHLLRPQTSPFPMFAPSTSSQRQSGRSRLRVLRLPAFGTTVAIREREHDESTSDRDRKLQALDFKKLNRKGAKVIVTSRRVADELLKQAGNRQKSTVPDDKPLE